MRKADIVQRIAEELGCTHATAEEAVEALLSTMQQACQQGGTLILRRFGTFQVRAKRARMGRNPRSGAAAAIAARQVVRFPASQTLKALVERARTPVP